VVHGDAPVTELFADTLKERGIPAHAPLYEEVYDLLTNTVEQQGKVIQRKPKSGGASAPSPAFVRLQDTAKELENLIAISRGRPNKDLAQLADQIRQIMEKWKL